WDMVSFLSRINSPRYKGNQHVPSEKIRQKTSQSQTAPPPQRARAPRARPSPSATGRRGLASSPGGVGPARDLDKRNRRPFTEPAKAVEQNCRGHVPRSFWLSHPLRALSGAGMGQELALASVARLAQTLLAQAAAAPGS